MLTKNVALVCESSTINASELTRVAAALQKQVSRDFAPIWGVSATVSAFVDLDDVPVGYWQIVVKDNIEVTARGIHRDMDGQPFALVQFRKGWPRTASHECLEMLADPFGDRLIAGQSPKADQGRVEFLVEVCDPCAHDDFAYTVNGILVSDFYTPQYLDPVKAAGVRYSYTGAITAPRQVLHGGYLTWKEPISGNWFQEQFFSGAQPAFVPLGPNPPGNTDSLRSMIDRGTRPPEEDPATLESVSRADAVEANCRMAERAKAAALRKRIAELETAYALPRAPQPVKTPRRRS